MAKNKIFSNPDPEQIVNELLRELQGLDRQIKNLHKAAEEARRYNVKVVEGIDELMPSNIKKNDLRALAFGQQSNISMLRSAIATQKQQLASINKKSIKVMKKQTKIEKEFEPDKIITGRGPRTGAAGHDRYAAIMATLSEKQRADRRHKDGKANTLEYDSTGFFMIYDYSVKHGIDFIDAEKIYLDPNSEEEFV